MPRRRPSHQRLFPGELLLLKRFNTPTVYNGWEQITRHNIAKVGFNVEEVHDFMPELGPIAGYAVTQVIEPGNPRHAKNTSAWDEYWRYISRQPGPKIVIVQDLDKPATIGAAWGEVNASIHRSLGCVGVIVDGAVRDRNEMAAVGFKALARRLCVGHACATPVRWGCPVKVFGRVIQPGQLIHADQHGFMAIPPEDEARLLDAVAFMDANECNTLIAAGRNFAGLPPEEAAEKIVASAKAFGAATLKKFGPRRKR
ncbi:MAG: RraA family protein [Planctomycetota bacterium]|nr:RraA family protein [Planctomycetota bacterium]